MSHVVEFDLFAELLAAMFQHARKLGVAACLKKCARALTNDAHPDILSLITTNANSLNKTKQCHTLAILYGLLPRSVTLSALLILRYASFGADPFLVFRSTLPFSPSSTYLYNTLIRGYTMLSQYVEGMRLYNQMVRRNVAFDDHTFPFVLKICADSMEVRKGMEVHGRLVKVGLRDNVFVGNTLLLLYGNSEEFRLVEKVFDEMPELDVVSWNTMVKVFSFSGCGLDGVWWFREMVSTTGFEVNVVSVVSVLPVIAGIGDEEMASGVHCYVLKVGLDNVVTVGNALVDVYGKCGNVEESKRIFDEIIERNDVSWNAIITSFSCGGRHLEALDFLRLMIVEGVDPNSITISSVMPSLVELGWFTIGREIHGYSVRRSIDFDVFVSNSLMEMYAKMGFPFRASNIFDNMKTRNVVSWNTMIANFAMNKPELEAVRLVHEMQANGERSNSVTMTNVLPACARVGSLRSGKELHARAFRTGSVSDLFVSNALMDMYAKCGKLNLAHNVFDISQRDEVSYNILIVGYSHTSNSANFLSLFSEMGTLGMKYDTISFVGVLSACANISSIEKGREIHSFVVRRFFHDNLFVANALLDLYSKCGRIDLARKIFDHMKLKDVTSWNTMILGYGMLGELENAINFFDSMKDDGIEYDSVSYVAVLSACGHGGLLEKGRKYFTDLHAQGIKPSQSHYSCMVDLLGRSGCMREAVDLIEDMPIQADDSIWGALLGACRLHGHVELGCLAAEHLLKIKPDHSGYYSLLSNMYAEAGKWDEAERVRDLMKRRSVKKNPGYSWAQT
ncbi:hypothetical protein Leryth_016406 [Lithospermum erythrorhizon]|nr:hypothetical protein Leryth_016406 [Lithospermum erythrorhizon]